MNERVAVCLSGGTAYGAIQVYSCEQIRQLHPYIEKWVGVSVGAQLAVLGAQDRVPRMREMFEEMDGIDFFMSPNFSGVFKWITTLGKKPFDGVYQLKPLAKKAEKELKHPFVSKVEVGVVDYVQGPRYVSVDLEKLNKIEDRIAALMASAAQPDIMAGWQVPIGKEKHLCFDGGVKHVIPLLHDWEDYDIIYVIMCSPPEKRGERVPPRDVDGFFEIAMRSAEAWTDSAVIDDVKRIKKWAKAGKKVVLCAPKEFPGEKFDASKETIAWRLNEIGPKIWKERIELSSVIR